MMRPTPAYSFSKQSLSTGTKSVQPPKGVSSFPVPQYSRIPGFSSSSIKPLTNPNSFSPSNDPKVKSFTSKMSKKDKELYDMSEHGRGKSKYSDSDSESDEQISDNESSDSDNDAVCLDCAKYAKGLCPRHKLKSPKRSPQTPEPRPSKTRFEEKVQSPQRVSSPVYTRIGDYPNSHRYIKPNQNKKPVDENNTFVEFIQSKFVHISEKGTPSQVKLSKVIEYYKFWCLFNDKVKINCYYNIIIPILHDNNFSTITRKQKNKRTQYVCGMYLTNQNISKC